MAKQDVLDAINATIIENGQKGITAQSLNNVLTMMAENAGEGGSGDGALRVMVPVLRAGFLELGDFSLTSWEEQKAAIETDMPEVDLSEMDAAVSAMIAHNAEVVQQLIEKSKAGQGVSVILDQTLFTKAYLNVLMQMDSTDVFYEDYIAGSSQFASYSLEYIKFTPEGEAESGISEVALLVLSPVRALEGSGGSVHYPESVLFNLQLDGSIVFEVIEEQPSSGSGVLTFYFPQDTSSPTSEETENNKAAYASFMSAKEKSIVKIYSRTEELGTVPFMIKVEEDDGEMVIILTVVKEENGTLVPLKFVATSDGYFDHL